jgi:hypothetical protein
MITKYRAKLDADVLLPEGVKPSEADEWCQKFFRYFLRYYDAKFTLTEVLKVETEEPAPITDDLI